MCKGQKNIKPIESSGAVLFNEIAKKVRTMIGTGMELALKVPETRIFLSVEMPSSTIEEGQTLPLLYVFSNARDSKISAAEFLNRVFVRVHDKEGIIYQYGDQVYEEYSKDIVDRHNYRQAGETEPHDSPRAEGIMKHIFAAENSKDPSINKSKKRKVDQIAEKDNSNDMVASPKISKAVPYQKIKGIERLPRSKRPDVISETDFETLGKFENAKTELANSTSVQVPTSPKIPFTRKKVRSLKKAMPLIINEQNPDVIPTKPSILFPPVSSYREQWQLPPPLTPSLDITNKASTIIHLPAISVDAIFKNNEGNNFPELDAFFNNPEKQTNFQRPHRPLYPSFAIDDHEMLPFDINKL